MQTFHIVWLLRNLSLDGKLCLRNDKIAVFRNCNWCVLLDIALILALKVSLITLTNMAYSVNNML